MNGHIYVMYVTCPSLSTVLFDEVRYVHTVAELQSVERAAKGKADIVLGHVQVLGLPGKVQSPTLT